MSGNRAGRGHHTPAVIDATSKLHPGVAAMEAAQVGQDLIRALAQIRGATDGRARLLSEIREHAAALAALTGYVAMFERNP